MPSGHRRGFVAARDRHLPRLRDVQHARQGVRPPEEQAAIEAALAASPVVNSVIHLRTLHRRPDEILVAAKIAIDNDDTGEAIAEGIDQAEAAIRQAVPTATYIFIEPDLRRPAVDGGSGDDTSGAQPES